jgi:hypothetical protein
MNLFTFTLLGSMKGKEKPNAAKGKSIHEII